MLPPAPESMKTLSRTLSTRMSGDRTAATCAAGAPTSPAREPAASSARCANKGGRRSHDQTSVDDAGMSSPMALGHYFACFSFLRYSGYIVSAPPSRRLERQIYAARERIPLSSRSCPDR